MSGSSNVGMVRAGRGLVYLVYAFVVLCLVILTLGFFLLLFGANPDAPFAEWVYRALDRAMKPFRGIFETIPLNGQSVLDVSVLFAMIVYSMLAMALRALIDWLTYRLMLSERRASMSVTAPAPAGAPVYEPVPMGGAAAAGPVPPGAPPR
jgi:uncharacterized protein YggT (Ycf19 family)